MGPEQTLKILMLEDNDDDVTLIEHVLRKENFSVNIERVETKDAFYRSINFFKPDIVLSDHGLPGFNSLDALKICVEKKPETPFILVAGGLSDELVNSLRYGASDYVLKSNLSRLPTAIIQALDKSRIERRKAERAKWLRGILNTLIRTFIGRQPKFKINEAVQHVSGGPLMVVSGFVHNNKNELHVVCQWFDRKQKITLRKEFGEHELKSYDWMNPPND